MSHLASGGKCDLEGELDKEKLSWLPHRTGPAPGKLLALTVIGEFHGLSALCKAVSKAKHETAHPLELALGPGLQPRQQLGNTMHGTRGQRSGAVLSLFPVSRSILLSLDVPK